MVGGVLQFLQTIDTELFNFINLSAHSRPMDWVMTVFSSSWLGAALMLAGALYFSIRRHWKAMRILAVVLVAVLVTDILCFRVIKPSVQRVRPCFQQDTRMVVQACGTPYTFPSNHAANAMAAATVVGLYFPLWAPLTVFIAFLVGLSRVYVGVHYPFDVMAGFLVGMIVATLVYSIARRLPERTSRA